MARIFMHHLQHQSQFFLCGLTGTFFSRANDCAKLKLSQFNSAPCVCRLSFSAEFSLLIHSPLGISHCK